MKRGPKSKLTPQLQKDICKSLEKCNTIKTSAAYCNVSERSVFSWISTNPSFAAAVSRARATAKAKLVKVIVAASPKDFRAACWLLERSYPGEYARTETRIIEQKAEEQKMGGCTILYNGGNHTLADLLDFPTMDDPPEVAAKKQRRLLEMTPAKNAPVSAQPSPTLHVRLHARHGSRDAAAISYERFSYTVTRYPCTSAVRPSFLAGTTESPSLFGRAPSPEKQLMILPHFSPIFGLVALTTLYFLAGTVLLLTAVLTLTAMALATAIAERRRAEAALEAQKALVEAANRTKDNFLAMLSHELRTPLFPVFLAVENLQKQWLKNDEAAAALEIIRRNIRVERHLIDDLLDVTRISKGNLVLNLTSVNAHGQIRNVVETCRSEWAGKKIRMQLDLTAGDRFVVADEARFQQIVWNLVQNAIKFSRDEGEIRISTANESPGELTIIVQDHGIGIEPEAMNRIFNPFEQGERSLKRRFGGLGLGLAISKSLAEAHAATLTAMSEGLNRGATFRLTIKTSALIAHDGTISLPVQARVTWVLRILLVDDHIDTCTVMGKLLAARGHRVTVAHDMKSALERIEAGGFDVVISDVGLPDGSGTELISKSKNRLVGIAMSGFGTDADARRSLEAGFSQHLIKPVTMEKLDAALQAAMNGPARDGWESALRR